MSKNFIANLKEDRVSPTISTTDNIFEHVEVNRSSEVRLDMLLVVSSKLGMLSLLFSSSLKLYKIGGTCLIMSPVCFLYLVELYLMVLSFFHGYFLTTKMAFVEWHIYQDMGDSAQLPILLLLISNLWKSSLNL
ncbi:hypothetical protein V6N13_105457 [Hibiscus sabdariffa]